MIHKILCIASDSSSRRRPLSSQHIKARKRTRAGSCSFPLRPRHSWYIWTFSLYWYPDKPDRLRSAYKNNWAIALAQIPKKCAFRATGVPKAVNQTFKHIVSSIERNPYLVALARRTLSYHCKENREQIAWPRAMMKAGYKSP